MTYGDLISHYRTESAAAAARGIHRQTVHRWQKSPAIPIDQQIEFEKLTGGMLRADLSDEVREILSRCPTPMQEAA
jgi:hypothetical protein